ncbi:MAG: type II secretion system F family protein [bacterium]
MPIFKYRISNKAGQIIEGEKNAGTRNDLINDLHNQGFMVVAVEEKVGFDLKNITNFQMGDISLKDKVFFVKQMAAMFKAGLPIIQTLEILIDQTKSNGMKQKLISVYKDIKSGLPLGASFAKYKLIFNDLQISLIQSGEQSGNLVEIMLQIAEDMQKSNQIRSKVRGALIYPIVVLFTALIVVIVLVVYMIPAVESLYKDLGAKESDIPAITRFLVTISRFFTNPFGVAVTVIIFVGIVVAFRFIYSSMAGRKTIDRWLMKVPIFGDLIVKNQVLQMVRLLGMLLKSGIPIIDALKATARAVGNIHFKIALVYTADRVAKGSPISVPLARSQVMPVMVIKMIATGEETGTLDQILLDLAVFYEDEVNEITTNLTRLMEPLMLLVVGGLVAFLAVAVYLPIYSISQFV